jgi:Fur family iron response transcriptional regulator
MFYLTDQELRTALETAGLRPTAQRLAIARYVLCEGDHPTVKEVTRNVEGKLGILSQATIYNTLNAMVDRGMLIEVRACPEEPIRYDSNMEHHHHLLDKRSGKLVDIPHEALEINGLDEIAKTYRVDRITVTIEGELLS